MPSKTIEELKRTDISERLAIVSLIIKVGQYIGESAGYKGSFPTQFEFASFVSMFLFGVSLVLWLRSSRKELEKLDGMASRVEEIKGELDKVDLVARYGTAPVHLLNLLRAKTHVYGHAGGEALCDVLLRVYARTAEDLHQLTKGSKDAVYFQEYHLVDKFLLNLMRVLPTGSVWLGATRLQNVEAWQKGTAEDSYFKFQELAEQKTRNKLVKYFRLWCFDDAGRQNQMEAVLQEHRAAGIRVRTCLSREIPDMSLIWIPQNGAVTVVANDDLQELFPLLLDGKTYEPLCAIEFDPRGGKELDSMTLYAPHAERFDQLRFLFQRNWERAQA